jgi:hypothetical protein
MSGPIRVVRQVHRGSIFDVHAIERDGQRLALKVPAEPSETGAWSAGPFRATRILGGVSTLWSVMSFAGSRGDLALRWNEPEDPVRTAEALLEDEARRLRGVGTRWNHTAIDLVRCDVGARRGLLGLVMPWQEGTPLAALPREAQRRLLPRMMPSLWDALSAGLHGDLHGSNILVAPSHDRFALLDPGAMLLQHHPEHMASAGADALTFVSNAEAYPILPPYSITPPLREGGSLRAHWESFVKSLTLFDVAPPFAAGESTIGCAVSRWAGRFLVDLPLARSEPHPADLLAVGIVYHLALTGVHPFYEEGFVYPAWASLECVDNRVSGAEVANARLARGAAPPSARDPSIRPAEDALALALLDLRVTTREQVIELAARAAVAAEAAT